MLVIASSVSAGVWRITYSSGGFMGATFISQNEAENTIESAYWFSRCTGVTADGGWAPGLSREDFDAVYRYTLLRGLLSAIAANRFSGDYAYISTDFEVIKRISDDATAVGQMINLRQRIIDQCNNSNSPQCAIIRELLDVYGRCVEMIDSEWKTYNEDLEKARAEARSARANAAAERAGATAALAARRECLSMLRTEGFSPSEITIKTEAGSFTFNNRDRNQVIDSATIAKINSDPKFSINIVSGQGIPNSTARIYYNNERLFSIHGRINKKNPEFTIATAFVWNVSNTAHNTICALVADGIIEIK